MAFADLPFDELRAARWSTRRELEVARLQGRPEADELAGLLRDLTDELIERYAADPTLIDLLLAQDSGARS